MHKGNFFFLGLIFIYSLSSAQSPVKKTPPKKETTLVAQKNNSGRDLSYLVPKIKLKGDALIYTPKNFYLSDVIDSTGTDSLGYAILPGDYRKQKIETEQKKEVTVFNFLTTITKKDISLHPVIIKLKQLDITESKSTKAVMKGRIELKLSIYCKIDNDTIFLDEFHGGTDGDVYVGSTRKYDSLLTEILNKLPEEIDVLIDRATSILPEFMKGVKISVSIKDSPINEESDTIFVNDKFFLNWSDYRGEVINEKGWYSSIFIDFNSEEKYDDGYLQVQIVLSPLFVRKKSWIGPKAKVNVSLQHEHYGTQLMYLYTLKMKAELEKQGYQARTYKDSIVAIMRRMDDEFLTEAQKYSYDTEYGSNKKQQFFWEQKIEKEIEDLKKN